jgi:hypothetical protein
MTKNKEVKWPENEKQWNKMIKELKNIKNTDKEDVNTIETLRSR